MLLNLLFTSPIIFISAIFSLVIAITIHEFAHAFVADKLGDPTPKINDRVTLNPKAHIDPIGAIALLIVGFGWGKPVPFDPYNLVNPQKDSSLIALAGPTSNLILALVSSLLLKLFPIAQLILIPLIIFNVSLAIFNLLPIPPLDGSKIITSLMSKKNAIKWEIFTARNQNILLIMSVLPIFGGTSLASIIISPIINSILKLLSIIAGTNFSF